MDTYFFIQKERTLIGRSELRQVIQDLLTLLRQDEEYSNFITMISANYEILEKQKKKGIISFSDEYLSTNKIINGLLEILSDLKNYTIPYQFPHLYQTSNKVISETEIIMWNFIDGSGVAEWYECYCNHFHDGFYISKAKYILERNARESSPNNYWMTILFRKNKNTVQHLRYKSLEFYSTDTFTKEIEWLLLRPSDVKGIIGRDWHLRNILNKKIWLPKNGLSTIAKGIEVELLDNLNYCILSTGRMIHIKQVAYEINTRRRFIENFSIEKLNAEAQIEVDELEVIKAQIVTNNEPDSHNTNFTWSNSSQRASKESIFSTVNSIFIFLLQSIKKINCTIKKNNHLPKEKNTEHPTTNILHKYYIDYFELVTQKPFFSIIYYIFSLSFGINKMINYSLREEMVIEWGMALISLFLGFYFHGSLTNWISNKYWRQKNASYFTINTLSTIVGLSFVISWLYSEKMESMQFNDTAPKLALIVSIGFLPCAASYFILSLLYSLLFKSKQR